MKKILFTIAAIVSILTINKTQVHAWEYDNNDNEYWGYVSTLNDSYYSSLEGLSQSEFRVELNDVISYGYTRYTYSNRLTYLRKTDVVYGDTSSVWCMYTGKYFDLDQNGSSGTETFNTEHTWAKSYGFPSESATPYSDFHHLRLTECQTNSNRSNSWFGEVSSPTNSDAYGNKWTSSIFEPRDSVKGDVARMLLYMDVRYDGENSEPDLELINGFSAASGSALQGDLATLLKWHEEDPVDDREKMRNDLVFTYQKNRNPFIDHPEYVNVIWGDGELVSPEQSNVETFNNMVKNINSNITLNSGVEIHVAFYYYENLSEDDKIEATEYDTLVTYYNDYIILEGAKDDSYFAAYIEFLDDIGILQNIVLGKYDSIYDYING